MANKKGNPQNLKVPSSEEARKNGAKGGKARAKKIKEQKTLKEELLLLLAEGDTQKKISIALINKALQGDTKAFEVIRDSTGQKCVEKVEVTQTVDESIKEIEKYMKGK
jgi:hypothetical protein